MSFNSCEVDQPHWITWNFVTQYLELSMEVLFSLRPSSGTLICKQFYTLTGYQTPPAWHWQVISCPLERCTQFVISVVPLTWASKT